MATASISWKLVKRLGNPPVCLPLIDTATENSGCFEVRRLRRMESDPAIRPELFNYLVTVTDGQTVADIAID